MMHSAASKTAVAGRELRRGVGSMTARAMSGVPSWATLDPDSLSGSKPCKLENLVDGSWKGTNEYMNVPDPMNGEDFIQMPATKGSELDEFKNSLRKVPKSGVHNPLKNPDRYNMWGEISFKAARALHDPEVEDFFIKCIQRTMPKHRAQALAEVHVSRTFLKNFSGDGVRFMARGFTVSGDHNGQESRGYRWPYGPVAIIAPFNFPLEIPVLQLMGALYMGNKPVIKGSPQTSMVLEQYVRLLIDCGMPPEALDLLHADGPETQEVVTDTPVRMTQFTGSSGVATRLLQATTGKVKVEDAGFDWKVVGPDVKDKKDIEYVAWQCDQDAYAISGQKCSAQSMLFCHENAAEAGLFDQMAKLAERRNLEDLSIGPVMSWSTQRIMEHKERVLSIPGAKVLFGGEELENHTIYEKYGAVQPTAIFVPLDSMLSSEENFEIASTELFGPFQIVTTYSDKDVDRILEACERVPHHLTAAVVSNDPAFQHKMLANTVNGTTYHGIRARTTGAPANHWFGPAGNPNGAGIGTPEAIRLVWSCHREIIQDNLIPSDWNTPSEAT
ncbi:Delta-1-pyrroline-5-carboxylate dehydrogenase 12A1, mitochondrial [Hondaea fermentalgiana]|uniref:Delta-1-pyrroline-5-carboxylate dehydrogenase 12A1, mitochondrial n=1 Tax=Hondaea fermentalgiana TaxID=2315210 RepID=A0A2R5GFI3_9STRA|nr:Delta-1-pyrroline-5-carboxylate dehydrogenase 12A1, mitochondrial [Hondaea fermentalgiana]|eukprot:GBG29089.1 Delta-1-pyrroline-5-carboxylate dehydrogenase 12A1, mitochondrial [Hondaea fermentalgiana]